MKADDKGKSFSYKEENTRESKMGGRGRNE